jgi:hypothetical protein
MSKVVAAVVLGALAGLGLSVLAIVATLAAADATVTVRYEAAGGAVK